MLENQKRNTNPQGAAYGLGSVFFIIGLVGLSINILVGPPDYSKLVIGSETLTGAIYAPSSYKSGTPMIAVVPMTSTKGRIKFACDLWEGYQGNGAYCPFPPSIKSLKQGDTVTFWKTGDIIWQLSHNNDIILSYGQAVEAYHRRQKQLRIFFGVMWVIGFASLLVGLKCSMGKINADLH